MKKPDIDSGRNGHDLENSPGNGLRQVYDQKAIRTFSA